MSKRVAYQEEPYNSTRAEIYLGRRKGYDGPLVRKRTIRKFIASHLKTIHFALGTKETIFEYQGRIMREKALTITTYKPASMNEVDWQETLRSLISALGKAFKQQEIHLECMATHRTIFYRVL